MVPWVKRAALGLAVAAVLSGVIALCYSSTILTEFRYFRASYDAAANHVSAPPAPVISATYSLLNDLTGALSIASLVLLLVWQFRAATVARWLGLPARRSPGWGVGSWFVPVVNLWMPYQAIRDCLPPGHPERRRVLRFWLALLGAGTANTAAFFTAPFSVPAAAVLVAAVSGLWAFNVVNIHRIVGAVVEVHGAAAGG
jgi:hypothetical protein